MTTDDLRAQLATIKYPGFSRDIVSFGLVKLAEMVDDVADIHLQIQTRDAEIPRKIFNDIHALLDSQLGGPEKVKVGIDIKDPPAQGDSGAVKQSLPGVKHIIAVASGKGGVGKSTVSANLAVSLASQGLKVGLCDCDLYGPSIAHMFGVSHHDLTSDENENIIPIEAHGIKLMSMGFLLSDSSPVIVRGPLANRYTQQFLKQVAWGELDVLVLDLPPGTGDIQLTIVQSVALTGSVIVTTPQEIALIDARKAVTMFAKVNVPILGLIENMSWFECDHGKRYPLFGSGGGEREAARLKVPLLAQIPLQPETCQGADAGQPVALQSTDTPYHQAAQGLQARLDKLQGV
ncbi:Mrp/NBP35 family ATP-binding protein [Roseibacillus ishigakijimensis]|uniref:Iron-sulfur cluster carrier protein n=1 Tax=Roseibacillus ishigakijimensis TaxID=454146 RepID=A0A934RS32_9BACT|nr:Mrp/NBP35 family ATP-binding protein [Roseibacillus ishigakijimensis]MBK1833994.1 Mrp/NBP35 family ATP-binding protein [Roseibacillus ishigakijimensis]